MRKIYTLLSVLFFSFFFQAKAQTETANFTFTVSGNTANFINTSTTSPGDTAQRRCLWLFGDGSNLFTHFSANPSHTYIQPGGFQACLKLFRRITPTTTNGDTLQLVSMICKPVYILSPDSCRANFEVLASTSTPSGRYFIAQPWHNNQRLPEQICWNFGDGRDTCINYTAGTTPPNNYAVFHQYAQPGAYTVCVNIRYQGGCVAHYCKTVQIGDPAVCAANFEVGPVNSTPLGRTFTAIPFHSQNKKPVKVCWNFGDNRDTCIMYSTAYPGPYSVSHNYNNYGPYNVCVKIFYDGGCEAYNCRIIQVGTPPDSCRANFEMLSVAANPLGRYFVAQPWHNNQKLPERICWNFGDGRDTCINYTTGTTPPNNYAVFHQYAQPGTYAVCVNILYQGGCEAHLCKTFQIGDPVTCGANFEVSPLSSTPLGRTFTAIPSNSQNKKPVKVCWNFGDNRDTCINYTTAYTGPYSVSHNYINPGNFNVCVKIFYDGGCDAYSCRYISIAGPDSCRANFEMLAASSSPLGRYFVAQPWHNNQKLPERICWNFGDGSDTCINYTPGTTPPNNYGIFHQYAQPGTYVVCVNIRYQGGCEAHLCKTLQIGDPVTCGANFEVSPTGVTPLTKTFTAIPSNSQNKRPVKICWNFGDNRDTCINYSTAYPGPYSVTHNYAVPGQFNVCVKIFYDGGCVANYCRMVVAEAPITCLANFETVAGTAVSPLTRNFIAVPWHSTQNRPVYICWNFGDNRDTCIQYSNTYTGPYSVSHTYAGPGQYNVCVRIVYAGGCEARKCKPVVIMPPPETCSARVYQVTPSITSLTRGLFVVAGSSANRPVERICWNFGDGSDTCIILTGTTPSPLYSINHTYPGPGVYHTCAKVFFAGGCIAQSCVEVVIRSGNGVCGGYIADSLVGPNTVKFKGYSIHDPGDNVVSYQWSFGDGTSAAGQVVTHSYVQPGTYQVCLLIITQRGCETKICKRIITGGGQNNPVLQLSPNPVINMLHAEFRSLFTEPVTIRISNSSGLAVRTYTRNAVTGINRWDFDLTGLLPGIYSFAVQSPNQLASAIFIKN